MFGVGSASEIAMIVAGTRTTFADCERIKMMECNRYRNVLTRSSVNPIW
jgi:hypothetical protein